MGKLAMWGAVAGAGKGLDEVSTARQEAEIRADESKIDHDRNMAIERFRATKAQELEGMRQEGATDRTNIGADTDITTTEMQVESSAERNTDTIISREAMQRREHAFQAEEGLMTRANADHIAHIRASASSASIRAALERFEPRVLTAGEVPEGVSPEMAAYMRVDVDTPAVYDKQEGRWYLQQGDRYILPGTKPEQMRGAPQEAIDRLFANPEMANTFLSPPKEDGSGGYGYLPMGFLSMLRAPGGASGSGGMLHSAASEAAE